MSRCKLLFMITLTFLLLTLPVSAQEEPHPLIELLANVPATTDIVDIEIRYADYAASIQTRTGTSRPASADEAITMIEDDREQFSHYLNALPVTSIPMTRYLRELVNTPDVLGLDFFKIDQSLMFGAPPVYGILLRGDFDAQSIITAHQARDYSSVDAPEGVTLLCYEGDCSSGVSADLMSRDLANIFGGELGRREPIALTDNLILNSPAESTLTGMIQTHSGEFNALGDLPQYHAAAQAATADGQLRQMIFWPLSVSNISAFFDGTLDTEGISEFQAMIETPSLPPYSLLAFAEVADVEQAVQRAQVLMVYADETTAERAGTAALERLNDPAFVSIVTGRPYLDILLATGAEPPTARVYADAVSGFYVAVIEFSAPLVTATTRADDEMLVQSGLEFSRLVQMVYQRDLLWLAVE